MIQRVQYIRLTPFPLVIKFCDSFMLDLRVILDCSYLFDFFSSSFPCFSSLSFPSQNECLLERIGDLTRTNTTVFWAIFTFVTVHPYFSSCSISITANLSLVSAFSVSREPILSTSYFFPPLPPPLPPLSPPHTLFLYPLPASPLAFVSPLPLLTVSFTLDSQTNPPEPPLHSTTFSASVIGRAVREIGTARDVMQITTYQGSGGVNLQKGTQL